MGVQGLGLAGVPFLGEHCFSCCSQPYPKRSLCSSQVEIAQTQGRPLHVLQSRAPVPSLPRTTAQGNLQTPKIWLL